MTPAESEMPLNNMPFDSEKMQRSGLLGRRPGDGQLSSDCCCQKENNYFGCVGLLILKLFLSVCTEFLKKGIESSVRNKEMLETEQLDWIHLCLRLFQMCPGDKNASLLLDYSSSSEVISMILSDLQALLLLVATLPLTLGGTTSCVDCWVYCW